MKKNKVKKEDFVIHFESSLTHRSVGNAFQDFLKTEFNQEPWEFIKEVQKLKEVKEKTQIYKKIESIYQTFIQVKSEKELNLSSVTRKKLESLKESESMNIDFFDEIVGSVLAQLKHDSWKRFYRSKYCDQIIYQHYEDNTICSPITTLQYFYEKEYFEHCDISDHDFDFGLTLMEDNYNWEVNFLF
jgi:hypothetical protein